MGIPQPPKTSKFRKRAALNAAKLIIKKGVQPNPRISLKRYWYVWQNKSKILAHTSYEQRLFWQSVLTQVSMNSLYLDINVQAVYTRIKSDLMPNNDLRLDNEEYRPEPMILTYHSKAQVKHIAKILGSLLSMTAHRCNIERRDFPTWYVHVWLTWMWMVSAIRYRKKSSLKSNEASTISITQKGDKIEVGGVQYTKGEALELMTKLSTILFEEMI